ncbi:hypothetical protein APR04_004147 [Promicromonospora umidemergens]|uniref:Uncharacterized protein n=1 Tax=Promicromonospora umidemergens TaxID=629679 RepID=A0ABP8XT39_9MICO|nr:hypothetical protein [Promicromonospora umidemergens]MCP2285219.1 hypothetical protein [Promicromonospora umidemergens]
MPPKVKLILIWLVVIFLLYSVVNDPEGSANVVRALWDVIWGAITNIGVFFEELFTGSIGR